MWRLVSEMARFQRKRGLDRCQQTNVQCLVCFGCFDQHEPKSTYFEIQAKILNPNYTNLTNVTAIQEERKVFLQKLSAISSQLNHKNTLVLGVIGEYPYS